MCIHVVDEAAEPWWLGFYGRWRRKGQPRCKSSDGSWFLRARKFPETSLLLGFRLPSFSPPRFSFPFFLPGILSLNALPGETEISPEQISERLNVREHFFKEFSRNFPGLDPSNFVNSLLALCICLADESRVLGDWILFIYLKYNISQIRFCERFFQNDLYRAYGQPRYGKLLILRPRKFQTVLADFVLSSHFSPALQFLA